MGRIIPVCIAIFGLYWAYKGFFEYGFWVENAPGGGFLPVLIGIPTALLSIGGIIKNSKHSFKLEKKQFALMAGSILLLIVIPFLGMVLTVGIFLILWLLFFEKYSIFRSAIYGVGATVFIYFIFRFTLHVPFPQGVFGI